jgi:predicted nucleic acid-binding protein
MNRAVLDSSVLLKSIFRPQRSLPEDAYAREQETHRKCRVLLKLIDEREVEAYIPRACIVETAAVARRLSNRDVARKISRGILESYEVADEPLLFDRAWMIATDTGCSGFDSYFIALAIIKAATLITDDNGMHRIARGIGVDSILVRNADAGIIDGLFEAEEDSDTDGRRK